VTMTRRITEPIDELVDATRRIKSGQLGYTTDYKGKNEFGELIESFNDMSSSLQQSNQKIMQHLDSLSNLYRVTLTFHSITNRTDLYREISYGVAELVDAEQCGLMLEEGDSFVHTFPAVGLDEESARGLSIPTERVLDMYHAARRKALIANDGISASPIPESDWKLGVRNLMFVWVRHKGELIGAIRVANKRIGDFTEEDVQPLAILANNVSVALENARLYEDLRRQMRELRDTQEQLVQAAKLAAIGELASNVAHEINNPLTSVLGYAELIKEEADVEAIMKDVEVIEMEALRAREIVNQLLEFSKKRPLELKDVQVNDILNDLMDLISIKLKDTRVVISKELGGIPVIRGDKNQLKQVFLNIINNAVYSMDGEGTLGINTYLRDGDVLVSISDTGKGIPKEIQERIFEPFFTTKKEKGTGLGLSVSYKIIQSHGGRIDVESEVGRGCRFTVALPVREEAKREGPES
jgi:signal transduction histidine kinase